MSVRHFAFQGAHALDVSYMSFSQTGYSIWHKITALINNVTFNYVVGVTVHAELDGDRNP